MRRCKVQDFYRKVIVFDVLINVFDVLINIHEGVKNIYEALVNRKLSVLSFISCERKSGMCTDKHVLHQPGIPGVLLLPINPSLRQGKKYQHL